MTTLRGVYRDGAVHLHEPLELLPNNTEADVSISPVEMSTKVQSEREAEIAAQLAKGGSLSECNGAGAVSL